MGNIHHRRDTTKARRRWFLSAGLAGWFKNRFFARKDRIRRNLADSDGRQPSTKGHGWHGTRGRTGSARWRGLPKENGSPMSERRLEYRRDETKVEIADVTTREIRVVLSRPGLGRVLGWPHDKQLICSLEEPKPNQNDFNLWSFDLDSRAAPALGSGTRITSDRGEVAELSSTSDGKFLAVRRRHSPT